MKNALLPAVAAVAAAVCSTIAMPRSARADGLIYNLPADGTRVIYDMTYVQKDRRPGFEEKMSGTLAVASVGKKLVSGMACRWIEFTWSMTRRGRKRMFAWKLLIPESALGKGRSPLSNVRQGWWKLPGSLRFLGYDASRKTAVFEPSMIELGPIPAFLPGPLADVKVAKPATIETAIGKLKARKLSGKSEYKQGHSRPLDKLAVDYELQLADKVPFGVAGGKIVIERHASNRPRPSRITFRLKLKSVDKKAKSGIRETEKPGAAPKATQPSTANEGRSNGPTLPTTRKRPVRSGRSASKAPPAGTPRPRQIELSGRLRRPPKWYPQLQLFPGSKNFQRFDLQGKLLRDIKEGTPIRVRGIVHSSLHHGGTKDNPSSVPPQWIIWLEVTKVEILKDPRDVLKHKSRR